MGGGALFTRPGLGVGVMEGATPNFTVVLLPVLLRAWCSPGSSQFNPRRLLGGA